MVVDLLPPGHEGRMQVLVAFARVVGDHAAIGDDSLSDGSNVLDLMLLKPLLERLLAIHTAAS